jgi:hypothetical protein
LLFNKLFPRSVGVYLLYKHGNVIAVVFVLLKA